MNKDHGFKSLENLKEEIDSRLKLIFDGGCSLSDMDSLLADIRELEERVIVIRYKAMERLSSYEQPRESDEQTEAEAIVLEPELPLNIEEVEMDFNEESESNQISLIDSIEELSREVSVNEDHIERKAPSLAERLESKPINSIMKALSVNQKVGLVNHVFNGNDELFQTTIAAMDSAENHDRAIELMSNSIPNGVDKGSPLLLELKELIERRYQ
ncbi:MAG: hypothetical protein HKN45_10720 [Flavobacteriales bacterium]|nr:hypothetical protein [Flavobacteriales bacterium]NNK81050.1 hypothetical protein [Flavobacteriales bacterium]